MQEDKIFSKTDYVRIQETIGLAEKQTSGEIRVHIEDSIGKKNVLDRAAEVFANLKMNRTKLRNGVLIYVATSDKKFAIIGDAGINACVESNFWDAVKEKMSSHFKEARFADGICEAILLSGEKLKSYFPHNSEDRNELSDEVSLG